MNVYRWDVARQKRSRLERPTAGGLLGSLLRQLRLRREVPLRVVAAATEMDSTLLSKIELNQRIPTSDQTAALAKFFDVPLIELEATRIATKFRQDFGEGSVANKAVLLLHEQAGKYRTRKMPRKP
jgi:transcriptional regulator with XRE-family HTH domain